MEFKNKYDAIFFFFFFFLQWFDRNVNVHGSKESRLHGIVSMIPYKNHFRTPPEARWIVYGLNVEKIILIKYLKKRKIYQGIEFS